MRRKSMSIVSYIDSSTSRDLMPVRSHCDGPVLQQCENEVGGNLRNTKSTTQSTRACLPRYLPFVSPYMVSLRHSQSLTAANVALGPGMMTIRAPNLLILHANETTPHYLRRSDAQRGSSRPPKLHNTVFRKTNFKNWSKRRRGTR